VIGGIVMSMFVLLLRKVLLNPLSRSRRFGIGVLSGDLVDENRG